MIRLLLHLPIALAMGLSLAWAGVLLFSESPDALLTRALFDLNRAYPDPEGRAIFLAEATRLGHSVSGFVPLGGEGRAELVRAGLTATALHWQGARRIWPIAVGLAAAGLCAGLVSRERLRGGHGYASPTAAGLARLAVCGGLLWAALFSLSPVPSPYASLYLSALVIALGGGVFAANLPLRL